MREKREREREGRERQREIAEREWEQQQAHLLSELRTSGEMRRRWFELTNVIPATIIDAQNAYVIASFVRASDLSEARMDAAITFLTKAWQLHLYDEVAAYWKLEHDAELDQQAKMEEADEDAVVNIATALSWTRYVSETFPATCTGAIKLYRMAMKRHHADKCVHADARDGMAAERLAASVGVSSISAAMKWCEKKGKNEHWYRNGRYSWLVAQWQHQLEDWRRRQR